MKSVKQISKMHTEFSQIKKKTFYRFEDLVNEYREEEKLKAIDKLAALQVRQKVNTIICGRERRTLRNSAICGTNNFFSLEQENHHINCNMDVNISEQLIWVLLIAREGQFMQISYSSFLCYI